MNNRACASHRPFVAGIISRVALAGCLAAISVSASTGFTGQTTLTALAGTWTGTSTCFGNRPACKNETVVYRFVPVANHPKQVRQLADKIIDGKRVPMGALVFEFDPQTGELSSEFTRGTTHGIWSYTVAGEAMTGKLVVLPERSIGRDVKVHRVADSAVPAAPKLDEYDN
jgi:hypothetical protein